MIGINVKHKNCKEGNEMDNVLYSLKKKIISEYNIIRRFSLHGIKYMYGDSIYL